MKDARFTLALLADFRVRPLQRMTGPFLLCGYDPMNMWRQDDSLYSTSFFLLAEQAEANRP